MIYSSGRSAFQTVKAFKGSPEIFHVKESPDWGAESEQEKFPYGLFDIMAMRRIGEVV
jgi:hypothetical protein